MLVGRPLACVGRTVLGREGLLFTPGPLTTSPAVKQAMLVDLGSRDPAFLRIVKNVRSKLLDIAQTSQAQGTECVLMQGSGTFAVESMLGSMVPRTGKVLIVSNGAYGLRQTQIARILGINYDLLDLGDKGMPTPECTVEALQRDPRITHVSLIHHETTTGVLNPMEQIGRAVKSVRPDVGFLVDSMSAFGAYPVNMGEGSPIDALVSSANKCIEGVPGFAFALVQRSALLRCEGHARSLSLDLFAQWDALEKTTQFRFTPPTHALIAFNQALLEHESEGGAPGRLARYAANHNVLVAGLRDMGFHPYLSPDRQGVLLTTYLYPDDPKFIFETFYNKLGARGIVIYPGKLTKAPCFRMGSIGRLFPHDMQNLVDCTRHALSEMGVRLPTRQVADVS